MSIMHNSTVQCLYVSNVCISNVCMFSSDIQLSNKSFDIQCKSLISSFIYQLKSFYVQCIPTRNLYVK